MSRFRRDVIWNVGGLGVAGAGGVLLNALIGSVYGPSALGSFNQVFAAYILFSQLGVLGVHHSTLKHVAEHVDELPQVRAIVLAAIAVAAPVSGIVTAGFYLSRPLLAAFVKSDAVELGVVCAAPGLFFFVLNKVQLYALNGRRHMRVYAMLQAGRLLFMLVAFGGCVIADVPAAALPVLLTASEVGTFVGASVANRELVGRTAVALRPWINRHVSYGLRGFMSGLLVELNTRVDVLMLGYFLSDAVVGVYSFAAILAEGFFQLLVVLRNNYNPILVKLLVERRLEDFTKLVHGVRLRIYPAGLAIGVVAIFGFYALAPLLIRADLAAGWRPFALLVAGMVLACGFIPFDQVLLLGDHPGWHTVLLVSIVSFNAAANAIAIPEFGILGAAAATGLSFVFGAFVMVMMSRWRLGLRW